jgi:DNA modification methylase
MQRRGTATSNFGVGRREAHDSTTFYARFQPPVLSADDRVPAPRPIDEPFVHGDARHMDAIPDGTVALVVTSPPYFAGKEYEEEFARDGVPSSYLDYLAMLTDVFAECVRKLEPGGRIAVNVANLGRKPYRSLSADVIRILEDDLRLLLRGELIWQKAEGASGSCAWGSFRSAANPVLRDLTERVVVASKGRFDRARSPRQRAAEGLPHESTMLTDDFLNSTLDVWSIPPESARRVGHPAPFPVELPEALIRLYTYRDDLVLDPFMGSGSALVAAARLGRRYVGYDLDAEYVEIARQRVDAVLAELRSESNGSLRVADGAVALAEATVNAAGFCVTGRKRRIAGSGVVVDLVADDVSGRPCWFLIGGANTSRRGGLTRTDDVMRALGRAAALRGRGPDVPIVVLATALPAPRSDGDAALRAAGEAIGVEVIDLLSDDDRSRLGARATAT